MRAETESGLPTLVCWASTYMVSSSTGTQIPAGAVCRQGEDDSDL